MSDSGRARVAVVNHDRDVNARTDLLAEVFASWAGRDDRTCAWMREMHAQKKTFGCRCSQRKREAGIGIEPVGKRRGFS